jgi:hypothetical protein
VKKLIIGVCLLACAFGAQLASAIPQPDAWILEDIAQYRATTWHYQTLMGLGRTPASPSVKSNSPSVKSNPSRRYKLWVRDLWRGRAVRVKKRFAAGPVHQQQWLCIHRYEGSWRDRGAPYYGGLQMDMAFMRHYGASLLQRKGTADNWTPVEQMWVAERAYRSGRGFSPWLNTARACGLL